MVGIFAVVVVEGAVEVVSEAVVVVVAVVCGFGSWVELFELAGG